MLLELSDVSAGYGDSTVLRDIDLYVEAGEVVALLGPNGAGKTTTLLAISGLLPVQRGRIAVFGRSVAGRQPHHLAKDGLAFIPDDRAIFPSLTVRESLAMARAPRRDPLEWFPELRPLLSRRAGLLSGGEQQMLALARVFSDEPQLILIDELSQGLAPVIVHRLLPLVRRAADEWGAGVLLVEQEVGKALKLSDRAYVLSHGHLTVRNARSSDLRDNAEILRSAYLGDAAIPEQPLPA